MITNKSVYNVTVSSTDSTDIPLSKVEPSSHYVFYVTGVGDEDQRGNTVSCTASTGT